MLFPKVHRTLSHLDYRHLLLFLLRLHRRFGTINRGSAHSSAQVGPSFLWDHSFWCGTFQWVPVQPQDRLALVHGSLVSTIYVSLEAIFPISKPTISVSDLQRSISWIESSVLCIGRVPSAFKMVCFSQIQLITCRYNRKLRVKLRGIQWFGISRAADPCRSETR